LISIVGLIIGQAQTVGTILLLIGTGWIAWSIWHQLAPGAAGPRVATDEERASPARAA
jgi:hypothetical protein